MQVTAPDNAVQAPEKPVHNQKQHWLTRTTHWLANFIGIGWLLNAIVSVEVFKAIEKYKPEELRKMVAGTQTFLTKLTQRVGLIPSRATTLPNLAKDSVDIALLGIGGFMVVPLQKLYAANRIRISRFVEKTFGIKPGPNDATEESQETAWHWWASRVLSFSAACSSYVVLKYAFPKQYEKLNEAIRGVMKKWMPEKFAPGNKTTEYYVAEQIATITSITTLSTAKSTLDRLFPAKKIAAAREQKGKDFRTRVENTPAPNSAMAPS